MRKYLKRQGVYIVKRIRQRQLTFLGHVLRKHGLENLVVMGKINGKRPRGVRD